MLTRIAIVILIGFVILCQAAIISVMKDESKKTSHPQKSFHRWLIIWAAINSTIIIVGYYIFTGTLLGWQL